MELVVRQEQVAVCAKRLMRQMRAGGADMVTFTPNGTHQLTINLAGTENAGAEGDLDVTEALTIVGNGTGNTILQAGTNATNGIDKVCFL